MRAVMHTEPWLILIVGRGLGLGLGLGQALLSVEDMVEGVVHQVEAFEANKTFFIFSSASTIH